MNDPCHQKDKIGLFILAGLSMVIIGGISFGAFTKGLPHDTETLFGTIIGGAILFARDIVKAITDGWSAVAMGRMSDQLAHGPKKVEVENGADKPVPVEEVR